MLKSKKYNRMKRILYLFSIVVFALSFQSCGSDEPNLNPDFEDMINMTIFDFIEENDSLFSKFKQILIAGDIDKTMSAYNPNGDGYTLFLPTNDAIDAFIQQNDKFSSFDDLLADINYVSTMARYHVVNQGIITNDFPFGALPELNLAGQYLTIRYDTDADSSYYKINNEAPVSVKNIEASNGYVHVVLNALTPVTYTTYDWLHQNTDFSIFYEAVEATGFQEVLSRIIVRDTVSLNTVTMFADPDSVFYKNNIFSLDDLIQKVSPENNDYTDSYNALYNFVGYHILTGSIFLSDLEGVATNYTSYGDNPVNINGEGIDLAINNLGKENYDTIVSASNDSTFVKYITFYYDESNILTQSGTVHFINYVMYPRQASRAERYFEFYEEPLFNQYREEGGEFLIEEPELLTTLSWTVGNDQLIFVKSADESITAWNNDYIIVDGDFSITYTLPRIVQGAYELSIRAHAFSEDNAVVEVFFDGVKIGGLIDLTRGGDSGDPYAEFVLGSVTLFNYEPHEITIRSLITGTLNWDVVHFDPI
jgi:uncharacterized surface protein with fasciclin (FAS1) repeats